MAGTHWSIAQRLECTGAENPGISSRSEVRTAQKETYDEVKLRQLVAHPGPRNDDKERGKGAKGKGKDEKGDRKGKGKGGDREKGEAKEGGGKAGGDKK